MAPKRKVTLTLSAKKKQKTSETSPAPEDAGIEHEVQAETTTKTSEEAAPEYYSSINDFYTHVINGATNLKDPETNEVISGPFLKLPPKKIYADYYQLIENPVSINEIRQATIVKHRNKDIINSLPDTTLESFKEMWLQLTKNAAAYNDPESLIVHDANAISDYAVEEIDKYTKYLESTNRKDLLIKIKKPASTASASATPATNTAPAASKSKSSKSRSRAKPADDANTSVNENEELSKREALMETKPKPKLDPELQKALDEYDDSKEDYTVEILKVLRHLLTFKVSHHKNSIPLSRVLMELPNRDDSSTEDYYDIVTEPMCFNMISKNLDDGKYSGGTEGYKKFISDINLIFDNVFDVYGEGPYYKAAVGLTKAFSKRLEKFETFIFEKKKQAVTHKKSPSSRDRSKRKTRPKVKKPIIDDYDDFEDEDEEEEEQDEEMEEPEAVEDEDSKYEEGEEQEEEEAKPVVEIPTFVRKHDVEKAETIEEIDDITAFIKRFTICSTTNLNNLANNWKSLINSNIPIVSNTKTNLSNPNNQPMSVFENIIFEPAGNTTLGGSTYSLQLPGSAVIGHEIGCVVHLQNKIVDEKYVSELRVNGESINGVPMSITYDEGAGDNGMFLARKYSIRLGYGLNYFEFTLKVPFPLKGSSGDSNIDAGAVKEDTDSAADKEDDGEEGTEKRERHERGAKSQEFVENIKLWLNITR